MRLRQYIIEAKEKVHYKQSKWSKYALCDKKHSDNLKLTNCKHSMNYTEVTCKKCIKEIMGLPSMKNASLKDFKYA